MQVVRQDVALLAANGLRRINSGFVPELISTLRYPAGVSASLLHILTCLLFKDLNKSAQKVAAVLISKQVVIALLLHGSVSSSQRHCP
ncbi:hypothetical protein BBH88_15500 [Planococcus antarcticus DSM 14505]|uniref:Uncharacterized protein n=1 Tax=Planococcus antarcticus DSM 14505 TaxID=1185653 RepID=A0ABM6D8K5_9BACL|nr:hypothetical protein BBH88_15500 [Planococcus antarcticus DSM 14505]